MHVSKQIADILICNPRYSRALASNIQVDIAQLYAQVMAYCSTEVPVALSRPPRDWLVQWRDKRAFCLI